MLFSRSYIFEYQVFFSFYKISLSLREFLNSPFNRFRVDLQQSRAPGVTPEQALRAHLTPNQPRAKCALGAVKARFEFANVPCNELRVYSFQ